MLIITRVDEFRITQFDYAGVGCIGYPVCILCHMDLASVNKSHIYNRIRHHADSIPSIRACNSCIKYDTMIMYVKLYVDLFKSEYELVDFMLMAINASEQHIEHYKNSLVVRR